MSPKSRTGFLRAVLFVFEPLAPPRNRRTRAGAVPGASADAPAGDPSIHKDGSDHDELLRADVDRALDRLIAELERAVAVDSGRPAEGGDGGAEAAGRGDAD